MIECFKKRQSYTRKAPLRALMRKAGAEIVSNEAMCSLNTYIEERNKELSSAALKFAKHAKRKKVTQDDINLAVEFI